MTVVAMKAEIGQMNERGRKKLKKWMNNRRNSLTIERLKESRTGRSKHK